MSRPARTLFAAGLPLSGVFAIRLGEIGVRYAFNMVLAVSLGVQGAGQFYLGISTITLAAALARFGIDSAAMRQLAVAHKEGKAARVRSIAALTVGSAALAGGVIAALLSLAAPFLGTRLLSDPALATALRPFAFGTLALAVMVTAGSLLSALDRPVAGQIIAALVWPSLATAWLLLGGAGNAALGAVLAMAATALAGLLLVGREVGCGPLEQVDARGLLAAAGPLFGVEMTYLLLANLPVLALGLWATDAEAGLFGLAGRVSALLTVLTVAMYAVAAPRLARLHAASDRAGLRRAAHAAARGVTVLALPAAAAMLAFPGPLLALFGEGFRAGAPLLVILALGQIVNVLFSQCHTLLAMSGNERCLLRCAVATLGVLGLALALLVPALGATGAAVATVAATLIMSLGSALAVRRRLGLNILAAYAAPVLVARLRSGPGRPLEQPE